MARWGGATAAASMWEGCCWRCSPFCAPEGVERALEWRLVEQLGRYVLDRKLASGGMAEVFVARQQGFEGFEKQCVVKRMLSHLSQDAEFVAMFLDEARVAAKLQHPGIAQIFDFGKHDDTYY